MSEWLVGCHNEEREDLHKWRIKTKARFEGAELLVLHCVLQGS